MLAYRTVELTTDRDFVLDMHSLGNFERESSWARAMSLQAYRERWLATSQPQAFLDALKHSLEDGRSLAEIWEEDGRPVGFLWLAFSEIDGHGLTIAEIKDVEVVPSHQRLGIGTLMVQRAEAVARERGAHLLRSETGTQSSASQTLHAGAGFALYRMLYEKRLDAEDRQTPPAATALR